MKWQIRCLLKIETSIEWEKKATQKLMEAYSIPTLNKIWKQLDSNYNISKTIQKKVLLSWGST